MRSALSLLAKNVTVYHVIRPRANRMETWFWSD